MKIFINVLSVSTMLMLLSTLICGLWIKANNVVEPSSLQFHMVLGILSVVLAVVLLVVLMVVLRKVA